MLIKMHPILNPILIALLLLIFGAKARAEGSKELRANDCSNFGSIQIWDNADLNRNFATYNAPADHRLYIHLNTNDTLYFGFNCSKEDVYYRLKNPNGQIVKGPTLVTSSDDGWISSCNEAFAGPKKLNASGYDQLSYIASMSGDFYIEFAQDNDSSIHNKRVIKYFDATVVDNQTVKLGRLWSEAWDLQLEGSSNEFKANMYSYSADSVVIKIDFNGIQPYGFVVSCNSIGASNIGSMTNMRKSDYWQNIINSGGEPGAPDYPIFLNDPDSIIYPSGVVGKINSFSVTGCNASDLCINVDATQARQVEIVMDFQNYTDRTMVQTVNKGANCISWDGYDGDSTFVANIDSVDVTMKYTTGITHLPLIDVENHMNGFNFTLIRPTKQADGSNLPAIKMFWNDSLLTDPLNSIDGVANLDGTTATAHKWQNRGTNNSNPEVINTWFYSSIEKNDSFVACPLILMIELNEFSAIYQDEQNILNWSVKQGVGGLESFQIEKSNDAYNFVNIGSISESQKSNYSFIDKYPFYGKTNYYRLKMIDEGGVYQYSEIISVDVPEKLGHTIPELINHKIKFNSKSNSSLHYRIFNLVGSIIAKGEAAPNLWIDLPEYERGIYLLEFQSSDSDLQVKKIWLN